MVGAMFLPRNRLQNDWPLNLGSLHSFGHQKPVVFGGNANYPSGRAVAIDLRDTLKRQLQQAFIVNQRNELLGETLAR